MPLRLLSQPSKHSRPLGLLDLGTHKVSCLIIARASGARPAAGVGAALPCRVLGFGLTQSRGIRAGTLTDLAEAEEALKLAVDEAESQAGVRLSHVAVSVTAGRMASVNFAASTRPGKGVVEHADIDKMLAAGTSFAARDGRGLLHLHRLGFRLDEQTNIGNPLGMLGTKLSLDLNAVTADALALRNISLLLERNDLAVSMLIAAPYASSLSVLAEEDLQATTAVIDLGAGTTSFAVFRDGLFVNAGALAIGGMQISQDIARALSVPINQAERIKVLYGNLAGALSDEHEFVPLTQFPDASAGETRLTRSQLRRLIAPRVDELLDAIGKRIAAIGLEQGAPERIVLTGGASQLAGLADVAARGLNGRVRIGWPRALAGLEPGAVTPAAAAMVGLAYAALVPGAAGQVAQADPASPVGYAGRLGRWFKDSFWDDEAPQDLSQGAVPNQQRQT